jgi:hypothetical protein
MSTLVSVNIVVYVAVAGFPLKSLVFSILFCGTLSQNSSVAFCNIAGPTPDVRPNNIYPLVMTKIAMV